MPRLLRKAAIRSEHHGAKRQARAEATGVERPGNGGGKTGSFGLHRQARSERQRAECARDRHPKGEDREAGFVEPGVAKPRLAE